MRSSRSAEPLIVTRGVRGSKRAARGGEHMRAVPASGRNERDEHTAGGLRAAVRPVHRTAGVPGREDRLVVPAPVRFPGGVLRGPWRCRGPAGDWTRGWWGTGGGGRLR